MKKRTRKANSAWEKYRDKHNALRRERNTSSLEKKIRLSSAKVRRSWIYGAFDGDDVNLAVKSFKPLSPVLLVPGDRMKFFEVESRAVVNDTGIVNDTDIVLPRLQLQ